MTALRNPRILIHSISTVWLDTIDLNILEDHISSLKNAPSTGKLSTLPIRVYPESSEETRSYKDRASSLKTTVQDHILD